jgi:hypothetical protein
MDKITVFPVGTDFNNRLVQAWLLGGDLRFNGYMDEDEYAAFEFAMAGLLYDVKVTMSTNNSISRKQQIEAYKDVCRKNKLKMPMSNAIMFITTCKLEYSGKEQKFIVNEPVESQQTSLKL